MSTTTTAATWTTVARVPSSRDRRKLYAVQVKATKVRCLDAAKKTCLGFKYSPVKWCRHLEAAFKTSK